MTTIAVNCECGRTIRVREEHAGRRIKCPQCGSVSIVPAPSPPQAQERRAAPIRLDDEDAGGPPPAFPAVAAPGASPGRSLDDYPVQRDAARAGTPAPASGPSYPMLSALVNLLQILAGFAFLSAVMALIVAALPRLERGPTPGMMIGGCVSLAVSGISLLITSEVIRLGIDAVKLLREIRDELYARRSA